MPDQLRDFGLPDAAVVRPQHSAFGEDAFATIHGATTVTRFTTKTGD
jgi:hypothetical protein